jgi:hypothetical protein
VEEGSFLLAALAGAGFVGGMAFESRVLPRWRRDSYFLLGLPLPDRLVPLPRAPRAAAGRTPSVRWDRNTPHLVRWWGEPGSRRVPSGLHGSMVLAQGRRGVELQFRWCPPWTLLLGPVWVAALGAARGEASLSVPLASVLLAGVLVAYATPASRVAAELRWSLASDDGVE